jgi:hypothetical protein
MKYIALCCMIMVASGTLHAQASELSNQHGLLAVDCKNIRGHAGRIVAEASQSEFNKDVAAAHLNEVIRSLGMMEKRLGVTKEMLTPQQQKAVAPRYVAMEKTCARLKDLSSKLQMEFEKDQPNSKTIKELATGLRDEMTRGKETHDKLMSELKLK